MRRFYSLLLTAAFLLVGMNVLAAVHDEKLDSDVASVTKGTETKYAGTLQDAIDFIGAGETGTVTLINEDDQVLTLASTVMIPHITGDITPQNPAVVTRAMQHITLDLNGHNIKSANTCIALAKGELFITGTGIIEKDGKNTSSWQLAAIAVSGAAGDKNNQANDHSKEWWSILTIDEHVVVKGTFTGDSNNSTPKAQGIAIINIGFNHGTNSNNPSTSANGNLWTSAQLGYETYNSCSKGTTATYDPMWFRSHMSDNTGTREQGSAFGVKVTIKGEVYGNRRGLHVVGHVNQKPYALKDETGYHAETQERYEIGPQHPYYYEHYYPWIILTSTAKVHCTSDFYATDEVAGLYVAGWAVVDISGEVYGQNGIFAKAGSIELNENAYIHSESPEFHNQGFANGNVSGNGIFLTTDVAYSGEMSVDINGNSKISGGGGAAIIEVVATATTTPDVNHITITGGTIEGGDQGAILLTEGSADKTVAYGGTNITGAIQKDGQDIEVNEITATGTHVTNVTDPVTGQTTIVISTGEDPTAKASWAEVAAIENRGNANWTGLTPGEINDGVRIELGELQMKAGDENNLQVLTIHDGGALVVNHLVMGAYARIIVEAGGLLIVDGTEGVYSNSVENILLKTTAAKHATFLYHPNVTTNSHPKATVEFATTSFYVDGSSYEAQRFGIPTWDALESFTCDQDGVYSQIFAYDKYQTYDWVDLGYLQGGTPFANVSSMNKPFDMFNLMAFNYQNTANNTYKMKGSLVGNANASVNANLDWNSVANSYTADINVAALVANLEGYNNVIPTVYIPQRVNNLLGHYNFVAFDSEWVGSENIAPMTIFMLSNTGADRDIVAVNYKNLVWDPATTSGSSAPRRALVGNDNSAKLRIIVTDEQGVWDDVKMTENATKSSASPKYINDDLNIYAQGDEKYAIIANDNLEDTYFGFSTVTGGEFTISFANVEGREFDLIDTETGAKVAVMEGETYSFAAAANTVADYRFKLVERAKMPTAIENTEVKANVKGIFTLTGQFLGEMNVWNSLPAGVYVVNGAKRVK